MSRHFTRFASILALVVLAAFAVQLATGYAEEAGLIECASCPADLGSDSSQGNCPSDCHLTPAPVPHWPAVQAPALLPLHAFALGSPIAPDEVFLSIDPPPKLA